MTDCLPKHFLWLRRIVCLIRGHQVVTDGWKPIHPHWKLACWRCAKRWTEPYDRRLFTRIAPKSPALPEKP